MSLKNLFWIVLFCNLSNIQGNDIQKTKSLWQMYRESKKQKGAHSLYAFSVPQHLVQNCLNPGFSYLNIGYHNWFVDSYSDRINWNVNPYAEYYIAKSLCELDTNAKTEKHNIALQLLRREGFRGNYVSSLTGAYLLKGYHALKRKTYELLGKKQPLILVPWPAGSEIDERISEFLPNTVKKAITQEDYTVLKGITKKFTQNIGGYCVSQKDNPYPPKGLIIRCDFRYVTDMIIHKILRRKATSVLSSYIRTDVEVTAHAFVSGAVEAFHAEVDCVVSGIKKRYKNAQDFLPEATACVQDMQ